MATMPMPADAAAMREHLAAQPPAGHGTSPGDMSMADMQSQHDSMHASGAAHDHMGMNTASTELLVRKAIGVHHTDTTSAAWDGPMMEGRCPSEEGPLRASHAWVDPAGDPAVKASYKFIHHVVTADGTVGAADTIGCSTGIGYLNHAPGTQGRPNIPTADRQGVYNHLAAHIRDADLEPPELARDLPGGMEEFRTLPIVDLEVRTTSTGRTFTGYAAVFNSWSEDLGGFREQIAPGAFKRTLGRNTDMKMFLNHNPDILLASRKAGTLRLIEDEKGLRTEADLPDTTAGRDVAVLLERRDISSMSFGFQIPNPSKDQEWNADGTERTLLNVRLFEVSPVTSFPAYQATTAFVRSLALPDEENFEALLGYLDRLTDEQRDALIQAANRGHVEPIVVGARLAEFRRRFAAKELA